MTEQKENNANLTGDDLSSFVDTVENDLRKAERDLEALGRKICSVPGSATTHGFINSSLAQLREAIRGTFLMRDVIA